MNAFLTTPSLTSTISSSQADHTISPFRHTTTTPASDNTVTTRASITTQCSWADGNSHCPARRRRRPPISIPTPLPSRDTSLNHQHSSRWALGTSYCRPVVDTRPPILAPIRPRPSRSRHDTGLSTNSASAGPWELHASACRRPSQHPIDQQRTPSSRTPLCRSLCSQLASSPHDHRRRPCFQLASDRTTAHSALRKPLLPTSKLATHWLIQHPQVMYHPLFLCTHIPKCVLLASAVAAA